MVKVNSQRRCFHFTKTSNRELQHIIARTAAEHIDELLEEDEITFSPELIDFSRLLLAHIVATRKQSDENLLVCLAASRKKQGDAEQIKRYA